MRKLLCSAVVMMLFLGVDATACVGQDSQAGPNPQTGTYTQPMPQTHPAPPTGVIPGADNDTGISPAMQAQQAKIRNKDRQKQLVQDTDKLLQLATQLKAEVDKTNQNILSVDVMRKADEIEKLAKSVKNQMRE